MSSGTKIDVSKLGDAISEELTLWDRKILEEIDDLAKKSVTQLVQDTKATAPVGNRKKHYKDSIKSKGQKTARATTYIWYVDGPDYRLSHLLENGHALRNGGRVEGTHFIKKATDPILDEYVKAVEEVLKNG